jgi:hypothetical protein
MTTSRRHNAREGLLSSRHEGNLGPSQEDTLPMTSRIPSARLRTALAAVLLTVTALAAAGCTMSQEDLLKLPTLADVSPTGPKGKKCYDRCAQSEVACKHMCPHNEGLCDDDCVMDTKFCLRDCPELYNHAAPPPQQK